MGNSWPLGRVSGGMRSGVSVHRQPPISPRAVRSRRDMPQVSGVPSELFMLLG